MIVTMYPSMIVVEREVTDPKFGRDESWFYYRLAKELKAKGCDVVKKLAYKDGHLVDDYMYYLRERKGAWCVYDQQHALRSASLDFDRTGRVELTRRTLVE